MQTVSFDSTLWFAGIAAQAAVVGLLVYKRVWRMLPVFCVYCAWTLLSNAGAYGIYRFFPASYFTAYLVEMAVDSVLEFGVLVEVAWSVLRPFRASLPRSALMAVGALIIGAGAVICLFVYVPGLAGSLPQLRFLVQLQQTTSILRILFFLVLAGCSQLFSIGWRDRELQVATGLGFYSLVSLAVEMLHTHQVLGPQYSHLNRIVVASYLCSLLYWVFSFAQEEAKRREFTPQMQNFLLAMAGNAKTARVELTASAVAKKQKQDKF